MEHEQWRVLSEGRAQSDRTFDELMAKLTKADLEFLIELASEPALEHSELAHNLLIVLEHRRDPRLFDELSHVWRDLAWEARRPGPPVRVQPVAFNEVVEWPSESRFPVAGGGVLVWERGRFECQIEVDVAINPQAEGDDSDHVIFLLTVGDSEGAVYQCRRVERADGLIPLMQMGHVLEDRDLVSVARNLRAFADHRERYLVKWLIARVIALPFMFHAKYLAMRMDLLCKQYPHSNNGQGRLVVRLHGGSYRASPWGSRPTVLIELPKLAECIAWSGFPCYERVGMTFERSDRSAAPQQCVRFLG